MKKRTIIIVVAILFLIFGIYKFSRMLSPGSYPFAEEYELNYSEQQVKAAISKFKKDNSQYQVPKVTIENQGSFDLDDHQTKNPSYWFTAYFYFKKEDLIILTNTRPNGNSQTTFAFVSVNKGLNIGNWKNINDDFDYFENKKLKKQFEEKVLEKLKEILEKQ
ncbi:hypothetical protein KIH23_13440 [Flavobacterium sp. CYK-55]|uniref:hypothetical protein n=1 Tax=Flavobacterium sp. CYK-55 TaxID=2835529 RepID=UPI001BCAA738|nr:hypothetical protein [Flavobacterium sp. CYK-55]MBS7788306.1 hypothetical protein [Flavobacterium sp. CYK-55]